MNNFLKRDNCGRLWFFWNGFEKDPEEYIPVSDNIKNKQKAQLRLTPEMGFCSPEVTTCELL